jgi:hypothetical protein
VKEERKMKERKEGERGNETWPHFGNEALAAILV